MTRMPVFGVPPPPEQWVSKDIVRIVDPLGTAVAWVAPALAGACIAFSTKHPITYAWHPVVRGDSPDKLGPEGALGIEALFGGRHEAMQPARLASAGWTMRERDPTSVSVESIGDLGQHLVTVWCDARALHMRVKGSSFAGFRLHVPSRAGAKDGIRWQTGRPGHLEIENEDRRFTVEQVPALVGVTDPKPMARDRALRMTLIHMGRHASTEPLYIHISEATSARLAGDPRAPEGA